MRKQHRGVTLIEVLMVIMISAAALSIAGVSGTFRGRTDARSDTDEVLRCLRLARETATMSQCEVSVRHVVRTDPRSGLRRSAIEWKSAAGPYRVDVDANRVTHFGHQPATGTDWMSQPVWLNEATSIKSDANTITFQPGGSADRDARWEVNHSDVSVDIIIQSVTGNILLDPS